MSFHSSLLIVLFKASTLVFVCLTYHLLRCLLKPPNTVISLSTSSHSAVNFYYIHFGALCALFYTLAELNFLSLQKIHTELKSKSNKKSLLYNLASFFFSGPDNSILRPQMLHPYHTFDDTSKAISLSHHPNLIHPNEYFI